MNWFYLAIAAYLINAIAFVIDKYLLSAPIIRPLSYAFWVGILSSVVIVLLPFGIFWPDPYYFLLSFSSGAAFFFALIFLYRAIKKTDISVASTKIGSLGIIFTYLFSILILKDFLSGAGILALAVMTVGILLLGRTGKSIWHEAFASGALMGISAVLLKWTFNNSDFLNGFFWTRIGLVATALLVLFSSDLRRTIFAPIKRSAHSFKFIFLANKVIAGIGFLMLYVAIKLGNVSIVSALLGVQFAFIFIFALVLGRVIPAVAEDITPRIMMRKLAGIALIGLGLIILFK